VPRLAAIDVGTNTVRLLVAEPVSAGGWRPLAEDQRITRLGQGLAPGGALGEEPMRRTLEVVAAMVAVAERLDADPVRVAGTSALREATNGPEFAGRVRQATGRPVEVLSGTEEARLALLGATRSLPHLPATVVLLDIGGGSTELVLARHGRLQAVASLRLGVVDLAERYLDAGPVTSRQLGALRQEVDRRLRAEVPEAVARARPERVVGTAGTVTTLAALDLGLEAYDPARVHGHVLTRPAVERLLASLGALTVAERARRPCLPPGRADLIVAGIVIGLGALDLVGADRLLVSDRGLREGLIEDLLDRSAMGAGPGSSSTAGLSAG
jgi:exopolyphosphatase/guanosine-5'-triphosphate,3'-diphosphate pyrophosphatase